MKHWEITDTGLIRHENQDAFGFAQLPGGYAVAVVCDGMGGVAGGSIASTVAVETFIRTLTETVHSGHTDRAVQEAVTAANAAIRQRAAGHPELKSMGTTLVSALVKGDKVLISNVGDSRAYLAGADGLRQISRDHSLVEDMVETCCVLVEQTLDQLLPHFDFDFASGWEDICFKNGPIVTPAFFRDVVMPRYKRIHQKLKAHGVDIWYMDCDGDIRPILDYFLEGGVNCMFPYEVNGCCHPAELLAAYGKDLRIMGGIDKMQLKAGRDAIRAYLESVAPLVERGGYIPFCDHRCPPDVREEDYLFYLDRKRDMFGMK